MVVTWWIVAVVRSVICRDVAARKITAVTCELYPI